MATRIRRLFTVRNAILATSVTAIAGITSSHYIRRWMNPPNPHAAEAQHMLDRAEVISVKSIPSRNTQLERLKRSSTKDDSSSSNSSEEDVYDILIIGGGATGCGVALDAISRGLKVALVERDDFASGTSSRSTKLIHGGVRYLEKAFTKLDKGQLHLVQDALRERRHLIGIAPHLSRPLPIIVPLYNSFPSIFFYAPYYYAGVKAYDFFAGEDGVLSPSYWLSAREAREKFPMLKREGLKGGVVYFDGQHNDSRMCLGIALTAAAKGAVIANHVEVTDLLREQNSLADSTQAAATSQSRTGAPASPAAASTRIVGAKVKDNLSGESFTVRSKYIVNATGPFCDAVRAMSVNEGEKKPEAMIAPSSGVHVVLSGQYSPEGMGLIIPETSDGRVLFLLPWEGSTVVGTTDAKAQVTSLPKPFEHEIQFILREVSAFLNHTIKRGDVDAAWSGIRPLAKDVSAKDTASASRDHIIEHTAAGMITIAGGKWTTYRKMAEDAVDAVMRANAAVAKSDKLTQQQRKRYVIDTSNVGESQTLGVPLIGAAGWSLQLPTTLERAGFDKDVAIHLAHNYGDKALDISRIVAKNKERNRRLSNGYPFIEAEVIFAARHEYAFTATDMIANRIRLGFLNSDAAFHALPRVINLMSTELGWNQSRKVVEYQHAAKFLSTMNRKGRNLIYADPAKSQNTESRLRQIFDYAPFREDEIDTLHDAFNALDTDNDGYITRNDVLRLVNETELFGLAGAKVDVTAAPDGKEMPLNKATAKFLEQLDLLDKDDSISFEPFLFSAAASFHSFGSGGRRHRPGMERIDREEVDTKIRTEDSDRESVVTQTQPAND